MRRRTAPYLAQLKPSIEQAPVQETDVDMLAAMEAAYMSLESHLNEYEVLADLGRQIVTGDANVTASIESIINAEWEEHFYSPSNESVVDKFKDIVKKVWEKIVELVRYIVAAIRKFFSHFTAKRKKLKKKVDRLKTASKKSGNKKPAKKESNESVSLEAEDIADIDVSKYGFSKAKQIFQVDPAKQSNVLKDDQLLRDMSALIATIDSAMSHNEANVDKVERSLKATAENYNGWTQPYVTGRSNHFSFKAPSGDAANAAERCRAIVEAMKHREVKAPSAEKHDFHVNLQHLRRYEQETIDKSDVFDRRAQHLEGEVNGHLSRQVAQLEAKCRKALKNSLDAVNQGENNAENIAAIRSYLIAIQGYNKAMAAVQYTENDQCQYLENVVDFCLEGYSQLGVLPAYNGMD